MTQTLQIVNAGVDTLKVNVKLVDKKGLPLLEQALPEKIEVMFRAWQEQAQQESQPVSTTLTFHEGRMTMLPNGAPMWRYLLKNNWLQLACGPRMRNSGVAKVTFYSEYLWSVPSLPGAIEDVRGFLYDVFGTAIYLQGSQIDLCADIAGLTFPLRWKEMFITRARGKTVIEPSEKDREYYRGRNPETLQLSGHGNPVHATLYNKIAEIEHHSKKKRWFYDLWRLNGWDSEGDVWRWEFSLERECLRDMKLDDIVDILPNIKRLWAFCTHEWLRMVVPEKVDKKRCRWDIHPTWLYIQRAFDTYGDKEHDDLGPLVRNRTREANVEQGIAQVQGMVTTITAWMENTLEKEPDALDMFTEIYSEVLHRWGVQGIDPRAIVQEKRKLYHQTP